MIFKNLQLETVDFISTITIHRPEKLNALNNETLQEIHACLKALEGEETTKIIILTGSGEKAFVAGADISEFAHFSQKEGAQLAQNGQEKVFDYIENFPKPIICAINGFALGGGLELALACHMRVASDNAKMGLPEVTLGLIPGYGGTQRLPQLVGKGIAIEMITTAKMITAQEAKQIGLVNHCTPQPELISFTKTLANQIIKNSTTAIAQALKAINAGYKTDVNGYETEIKAFGESFATPDFKEGTTAFLEKRKPNFTGK
jgi:enoyl-CoA hydratase